MSSLQLIYNDMGLDINRRIGEVREFEHACIPAEVKAIEAKAFMREQVRSLTDMRIRFSGRVTDKDNIARGAKVVIEGVFTGMQRVFEDAARSLAEDASPQDVRRAVQALGGRLRHVANAKDALVRERQELFDRVISRGGSAPIVDTRLPDGSYPSPFAQ